MKRTTPIALAVASLATPLFVGCVGGQSGEEQFGCVTVGSTNLSHDETSTLGFSGDALIASLPSALAEPLTWGDDTTTDVSLEIAYDDGAVRLLDRELTDSSTTAALECSDRLEVVATLAIQTTDGRFNEMWQVPIQATALGSATVLLELEPDSFSGTLDVASFQTRSYEHVTVLVSLIISGDAIHGSIEGLGTLTDGGTARQDGFSIATF